MLTAHPLCSVYFHQEITRIFYSTYQSSSFCLAYGKEVNQFDDSCRLPDWCVSKSGDERGSPHNSRLLIPSPTRESNPLGASDKRTWPNSPITCIMWRACVAHDHHPGSKSGVIGSSGDRSGPGRGFSIQLCLSFPIDALIRGDLLLPRK
jgi:hypothetical protein